MRMLRREILLFAFLLLIPIALMSQYKVMFSNNYPPYNYINDNGELVGFNVDILNAINDLYDIEIITAGGNWNYINKQLDEARIQAIAGVHYPGSSDNNYIYTRSAISTSHCFFYNTEYYRGFSMEKFRSIKSPVVAMWKNDVLTHYVLSINPSTTFVYINNYKELIFALDNKDITCIFAQRISSLYQAYKWDKTYIRPLDHRILERNMGFKVSKSSPELADILNNGLEVILANGEYQSIYDKWISKYDRNDNIWLSYLKYILIIGAVLAVITLILLGLNWVLRSRIRSKTADLQHQLDLNNSIMIELEKEKIRAEESDKMKSAFLANMSHEIRTPMNGILGFANLLMNVDYPSEKRKQFIEVIQQSGNRMLSTINNIIDVSKLESGVEKTHYKEVDVNAVLTHLINFFTPEIQSKGLKFVYHEKSPVISKGFITDEYKLNSILTNLIKNAIKFTYNGQITVTCNVDEENAEFWIEDTGIGIECDKWAGIFNHFVQVDNSYSRGFEGSGLGLSITKGYVEILNGEITLESEVDKGSVFYVRIPNNTAFSSNGGTKTEMPINLSVISDKFNFLIAEDDQISRFYLKQLVGDISKNIHYAANGNEAVDLVLKNKDIDIVLMDIKMPIKNGLDATREIRKFNKDIFIIAQTAYAQQGDKEKIMKSGCNAFISKPVDKNELMELIASINN